MLVRAKNCCRMKSKWTKKTKCTLDYFLHNPGLKSPWKTENKLKFFKSKKFHSSWNHSIVWAGVSVCWKKFVSIVSVCAYTSRWKRIIWKLTSEVGLPRMEDLVYARLSPRVFPDGGLNPRPASFLRCLGTVGRWRRPRCTVSAGSLTMWAGLWSSVTSVKTGFTAGT